LVAIVTGTVRTCPSPSGPCWRDGTARPIQMVLLAAGHQAAEATPGPRRRAHPAHRPAAWAHRACQARRPVDRARRPADQLDPAAVASRLRGRATSLRAEPRDAQGDGARRANRLNPYAAI
jgi:hypothetical protein